MATMPSISKEERRLGERNAGYAAEKKASFPTVCQSVRTENNPAKRKARVEEGKKKATDVRQMEMGRRLVSVTLQLQKTTETWQ